MAYTVKKLAKISGVSVRTLHFYDEIGLLKPSYYGDNGYRYYEEEQLLMLQQILFFRELGFQLGDVQKIIGSGTFDKLKTLESHRHVLQKNTERTRKLIGTIDKTIARLKGEAQMSDEEVYYGFSKEKQESYESFIMEKCGKTGNDLLSESKKKIKGWEKEDYEKVKKEQENLHAAFTEALKKNLQPNDIEVQKLVKKHHQMILRFYTPTKEVYIGLGQLYIQHPDFRKLYNSFHPKLAEFLAAAMKEFAEEELD